MWPFNSKPKVYTPIPNVPCRIGNSGWVLWDGNAIFEARCDYRFNVELGTFISLEDARSAIGKEAEAQHENWQAALYGAV